MRMRRQQKAPRPIKLRLPKPDLAALTAAYEWMGLQPALAYKAGFAWYDENIPRLLVGKPLASDQAKALERAAKARALGDSSSIDAEKLQAWSTAMSLYQKTWPKLPKAAAPLRTSRKVQTLASTLDRLQAMFRESGFTFHLSPTADLLLEEGNCLMLPETQILEMATKPPLAVALEQGLAIARAKAVTMTAEGGLSLDFNRFVTELQGVNTSIVAWAQTQATKALFAMKAALPPAVKVPRVPRAMGTAKAAAYNGVPAESAAIFRAGSAKGDLASLLADLQPHPIQQLVNICQRHGVGQGLLKKVLQRIEQRTVFTVLQDTIKKEVRLERKPAA